MELTFENCIFMSGKVYLEALLFSWGTAVGSHLAQDRALFFWLTKPLSSVPRMGGTKRLRDKSCNNYTTLSIVS